MKILLETERLILREFTAEDAPLLCELDSDPEVMRYISHGMPTPLRVIEEETLPAWLAGYRDSDQIGFFAAHQKPARDFCGWFHLRPDRDDPRDLELGYRLRREVWGRGLATEGCLGLIEHAFEKLGVARVTATTLSGNASSQRVMQKSGLRFVGPFIYSASLLPGWSVQEREGVRYALERADYASRTPE